MYRANKGNVRTVIYAVLFFCLIMAVSAVTLMAAADSAYAGSRKPNTLKVSGKTVEVESMDLSYKSVAIVRKKVLTVKKAKGKVTYKITKVTPAKYRKYFGINKKTGKVTVRKGLETGTYKIKATVTAAGNKKYKKMTRKATFKVVVKEAENEPSSGSSSSLDMYCAETAMQVVPFEDLEFFNDTIITLQPQAVNMILKQFPGLTPAADEGQIGRELSLYIYCEKGDDDGKPSHYIAEPSRVEVIGRPYKDGDNITFRYLLAVDVSVFLDDSHNFLGREEESVELLKNRLTGEMMRALMFDYNRTGMIGATDISNVIRDDDGNFPDEELTEMYNKTVFPKWFTEGTAASVENTFRSENDQFKMLRSTEKNDLLNNYLVKGNGFDLEDNVLTCASYSSCRASGYLAVLYLSELVARSYYKTSIDENGAVSAENLRFGLYEIIRRMHEGETLDSVIYDFSPYAAGYGGKKLYNNTEEFEKRFIKGEKDSAGQYAGDKASIDFVNTLLDYLESGDGNPEGERYGGSILTDLTESCSPLDASKEEYSEFLRIQDSNESVESTVPNEKALAGGGRSISGFVE